MKKVIIAAAAIILLSGLSSSAQQLPQFTQYMFNTYLINPAVSGTHNYYQMRYNNRFQWVGVTDAPQTYSISAYGPHGSKDMGFGGNLYHDITGPTSRTGGLFSYSYNMQISENGMRVSGGISLGFMMFRADGSKYEYGDAIVINDPAINLSTKSVFTPDADKNALMLLKKQLEDIEDSAYEIPKDTKPKDRPKLKKLHKLFEWVSRMVKKYGHDRLLIMIESYQKMGYITDDACTQVEEISKLMPEYIGDLHEISSEEFVAELYILNRILSPEDSSLDREMIEVMMDKKEGEQNITALKSTSSEETSEEDWIEMLEKF